MTKISWFLLLLITAAPTYAQFGIMHLRDDGNGVDPIGEFPDIDIRMKQQREWIDFPEKAAANGATFNINADHIDKPQLLWIVQEDVKARWEIRLNEKHLGYLKVEEDRLVVAHPIKPNLLKPGVNKVSIGYKSGKGVDDIRVDIRGLTPANAPETPLTVNVTENGKPIPARFTLISKIGTNKYGHLPTLSIRSNDHRAVREGVVYTLRGKETIPLPPGQYVVHAGRGFEYSLGTQTIQLGNEPKELHFELTREVDTSGLISCDTHVHTTTYSKHGDCTLTERMITLAGENVELAIATDHNQHIDYQKEMQRLGINQFTAVTGNEYTTRTGHFNLFPLDPKIKPPTYIGPDWEKVMTGVQRSGATIAILNHGRDIHANWRPFDPENHDQASGKSRKGYDYRFNAMELINSGATLNDPMVLYHDWFGLLNAGQRIAGIGSSDSHDVSNFIVGQGRTYIPMADDQDVAHIDVDEACKQLLAGNGMVSYGLLTQLSVQDSIAKVDVQAPSWIKANRIQIFANGKEVIDESIEPASKIQQRFNLPVANKRTFYVAVARGPGITGLYWPAARPYQNTGPNFVPYVLGSSAVIWITP